MASDGDVLVSADLTQPVLSPALNNPTCHERAGMYRACSDGLGTIDTADDRRAEDPSLPTRGLPLFVVPPTQDSPVRSENAGMVISGGYGVDVGEPFNRSGCNMVVRCAVSELSLVVVAPAHDLPPSGEGTGVTSSQCELSCPFDLFDP
jgi:hypothetical protein